MFYTFLLIIYGHHLNGNSSMVSHALHLHLIIYVYHQNSNCSMVSHALHLHLIIYGHHLNGNSSMVSHALQLHNDILLLVSKTNFKYSDVFFSHFR